MCYWSRMFPLWVLSFPGIHKFKSIPKDAQWYFVTGHVLDQPAKACLKKETVYLLSAPPNPKYSHVVAGLEKAAVYLEGVFFQCALRREGFIHTPCESSVLSLEDRMNDFWQGHCLRWGCSCWWMPDLSFFIRVIQSPFYLVNWQLCPREDSFFFWLHFCWCPESPQLKFAGYPINQSW